MPESVTCVACAEIKKGSKGRLWSRPISL